MKHKNKYLPLFLLLGAMMNLTLPGEELITDNLLEQFQPTSNWALMNQIRAVEGKKELEFTPTLFNGFKKEKAPYLLTAEEFDDVEVNLEFMIPEDSNAGVYLMGRYEVQILDSYGNNPVKFSDLGGIYQRWRTDQEIAQMGLKKGEFGYEGVAPLVNAAKAAGEWQEMNIVFRAPRFDTNGNKTENARFVSVHVNGKLVQKNTSVTGPTRSAPLDGEATTGPIAIQGDHGPIAIRSYQVTSLSSK